MSLALFDPIDPDTPQSMDQLAVELRQRLPWLWTPGFAIAKIEGYQAGYFGARAGTYENVNAYNVLHEVGHAIELVTSEPTGWKRRLGLPHFGMRIKSYVTVAGQRYHEPRTMQATERECRVGAIQLRLFEAGGYAHEDFKGRFIRALVYMADDYFGGDTILNAHVPEKYTDGHKTWVNTRAQLFEQAYASCTLEGIQAIWGDVSKHLAKKAFSLENGAERFDVQTAPSL